MQTKIVRLHSARRNPAASTIHAAEIREMRRRIDEQNSVIAALIMEVRTLKRSVPPAPFGLDPRGPY